MKLLIVTQKMNKDDTVMGFFHNWVKELANDFDAIEVICLEAKAGTQAGIAGEQDLPKNVTIFSLGKEKEAQGTTRMARLRYSRRFLGEIIRKRKDYDAVLVHMNQEYILLGGWFWKLAHKRVYMWRNHHAGSVLTDIAAAFCTKVFCTSRFSYTARYEKTVIMPVGIDMNIFEPDTDMPRVPGSILFLGRISPVKQPLLLVEALGDLKKKQVDFKASFYGDPLPKDVSYYTDMKNKAQQLGLAHSQVTFFKGIPNIAAPTVYSVHEIFVNLSSSGMYDKTIFEAMACGCLVLASNKNLRGLVDDMFIFEEGDRKGLVEKLQGLLSLSAEEKTSAVKTLRSLVEREHGLKRLTEKLATEMTS